MINRVLDWICARMGLCLKFDGDLVTPDVPDGAGDPHYRQQYITTPQQHAARLKGRKQ